MAVLRTEGLPWSLQRNRQLHPKRFIALLQIIHLFLQRYQRNILPHLPEDPSRNSRLWLGSILRGRRVQRQSGAVPDNLRQDGGPDHPCLNICDYRATRFAGGALPMHHWWLFFKLRHRGRRGHSADRFQLRELSATQWRDVERECDRLHANHSGSPIYQLQKHQLGLLRRLQVRRSVRPHANPYHHLHPANTHECVRDRSHQRGQVAHIFIWNKQRLVQPGARHNHQCRALTQRSPFRLVVRLRDLQWRRRAHIPM